MTVWQLDDLHVPYLLKRAPRLVLILSICQYAFLSEVQATAETIYVPGKLSTYPSPKPTLTLTSHLEKNVDLREG